MPISRLAALIVALLGLVFLTPVILMIAILVRIGVRGSLLVSEKRQHADGTVFSVIRFRTNDVDSKKPTEFGGFVREYALDRLPALATLLLGEMTLREFWDLTREPAA